MKMLAVKNFFSTSIIYYNSLQTSTVQIESGPSLSSSFVVIRYCFYLFIRLQSF